MSAIRSSGGKAETLLRSTLHRRGYRFRKNYTEVLGKPDIVFRGARVAVFVDGDYWHARVLRERGRRALEAQFKTSNRAYWVEKLTKNAARDDYVTNALEQEGWMVVRMWESEVLADVAAAADLVAEIVERRVE